MSAAETSWIEANQRDLMAAIGEVRIALDRVAKGEPVLCASGTTAAPTSAPSAAHALCSAFGLSRFERAILLMCAGVELDGRFAGLCAAAQGDPAREFPTFSLALAGLPEPHWSAVTPAAPLRRWRLIECENQPGAPLLTSRLRIDERVLHFLTGIQYLDERLMVLLEPVEGDRLASSQQSVAREIAAIWTRTDGQFPLIQLCGADAATRRSIAAAACSALPWQLYALAAGHIPASAPELDTFARLWHREVTLSAAALCVETESLDRNDPKAVAQVSRLLETVSGPIVLAASDRWPPLRRPSVSLEAQRPTAEEQRRVWQSLLAETRMVGNGQVDNLIAQFSLTVPAIHASVRDALWAAEEQPLDARLWNACRVQARPRLDDLAQRIQPTATWDDLVLPAADKSLLREVAAQVAHRGTVYETWGFAEKIARGLGISAMFSGPSGTGKTMAAEVLANELQLDLYRIDLASVVSKYIGETEKNSRRVFDAAEDSGAILFFDEADALFGKRSEVKDSHDRYANIEVSYLLQRMEAYRGLAVLATNLKNSVDTAFLRRVRFVVNFPFPDAPQRAEIWRRAFPEKTPTDGLDVGILARLNIAGGNIRNIALNAAFLAAQSGEPVRMTHVLHSARTEYAKLEKPLVEIGIGVRG
jgi:SpoVK/Ycf46/Vps4 family AAA+-type ATPase